MRRGPNPSAPGEKTFAGSLLVAHPSLRDPNFRRSVLFLSAHGQETGAFGVILNRPVPGQTAADLLPGHEKGFLLGQIPVFLGGPVAHDQLTFADLRLDAGGGVHFQHNLSLEDVGALVKEDASRVRAIVGYAGWSGGQLEGELRQNAWVLVEPKAHFFRPPTGAPSQDRSWFRIMNSLGPAYKLLAAAPDDPSLN